MKKSSVQKVARIKKRLESVAMRKDAKHPARISVFLWACGVLLERGFALEVDRHVEHFLRERQQRGDRPFMPVVNDHGKITFASEMKWWASLTDWALCVHRGRTEALKRIPWLLFHDRAFFLGQPWVQEHLTYWLGRGDEQKVHHLFFGTA